MARGSSWGSSSRSSGMPFLSNLGSLVALSALFSLSARSRAPSCHRSLGASLSRSRRPSFVHRQQGAMAADPGAERRHPPQAAGRPLGQRLLEHEVDARATDVSMIAQHSGTKARVMLRNAKPLLDRGQNFAAARMKDPRANVLTRHARAL